MDETMKTPDGQAKAKSKRGRPVGCKKCPVCKTFFSLNNKCKCINPVAETLVGEVKESPNV